MVYGVAYCGRNDSITVKRASLTVARMMEADVVSTVPYAHTREGRPREEWHGLFDHLQETARLAGQFASGFGSEGWGYLTGLWHDIGKSGAAFQAYLTTSSEGGGRRSRVGDPGPARSFDGRGPACGKARSERSALGLLHRGASCRPAGQSRGTIKPRATARQGHRAHRVRPVRALGQTVARATEIETPVRSQPSETPASRWPSTQGCSSRASWMRTSWTPSRS